MRLHDEGIERRTYRVPVARNSTVRRLYSSTQTNHAVVALAAEFNSKPKAASKKDTTYSFEDLAGRGERGGKGESEDGEGEAHDDDVG